MDNTIQLIDKISATSKRNEKELIISDAFIKGERAFFIGAKLAYDFSITFGVKKVAEITEDDGFEGNVTFDQFVDLCNKLSSRKLTGNAAKNEINDMAMNANADVWNKFYRRILLKNLNIGVDVKTINKILKNLAKQLHTEASEYMIPVFDCQLANDGNKEEKAKKLKGRKLLDYKLDGVRTISILNKAENSVKLYSRSGIEFLNFDEIKQSLLKLLEKLPNSVVLDGEIVSTDFQTLMKQVSRKDNVDTSNCKLALFDILPLDDFIEGKCDTTQEKRHEILTYLETAYNIKSLSNNKIFVNPKISVNLSTPEGQAKFKEFNKKALQEDYEGIMVKDPLAPYELKRSDNWLKIKPYIEVTLTVHDIEQGDPNGKFKNTLGSLVCKGIDDGFVIHTNVSSGLSEEDREKYWKNPKLIIGMLVEIRGDKLTKEEGSDVYSMRFPTFKGVRGTTPGEKI